MRNRSLSRWQFIASCAFLLPSAAAGATPLKIERVVMLMRHGIRPPTKLQPVPAKYSPLPWPKWPVGPGLLTPRGAEGIGLIAAADRAYFISAGLLPSKICPAAGQVVIRSSHVPRAIATAKAWSRSLLPSCKLDVEHAGKAAPDPLFHILDDQPAWFDGHRAYEAALAQPPRGGPPAQAKELGGDVRRIGTILGCDPPACGLETDPTKLVERPHGRPDFSGPLDVASTASKSFLLEYLEGMPIGDVGWGRASRAEIERLLVFNSVKFKYVDRTPFIAKAAAGPLARAILGALSATDGSRITLFAGHDTNIADLGGLFGMHWHVASYPADAVPPGSAIGFELLSNGTGRHFVRAFYRSQTMDQLRNLEPLGAGNQPYRQYLEIPGCGSARQALSCDLPTFTRFVQARLR